MALEGALELPQSPEDLLRKETFARECGILNRTGMPLAHNEPVPIFPLRALGIDPHEVKIEGGHDVRRRQRASGMAGAGVVTHFHYVTPKSLGLPFQFLN
jgi:hypothetical protein